MTNQTVSQLITALGVLLTMLGGFGSYYFGKQETDAAQAQLKSQVTNLQKTLDQNTELVFHALNIKDDVWTQVPINNVPPGVADYLLLLFRSDAGRISGKVRVVGSGIISSFSTTANDNIPVAVPNVWDATQHSYRTPTVIEFSISEKTNPKATLSILTKGWIDRRGQEPR